MQNLILFTCLILFSGSCIYGQKQSKKPLPDVTPVWDSIYSTEYKETMYDVKWLSNGNRLVAVGEAETPELGRQGVVYVIDATNGKVLHYDCYGDNNDNGFRSVALSNTGDLYLVGYTKNSKSGEDGWIVRLDHNYKEIWRTEKEFISPGDDKFEHIIWDAKENQGIVCGKKSSHDKGSIWQVTIRPNHVKVLEESELKFVMADEIKGMVINSKRNVYLFGNTLKSKKSARGDIWFSDLDLGKMKGGAFSFRTNTEEKVNSGHVLPNGDLLLGGTSENSEQITNQWLGWVYGENKAQRISNVIDRSADTNESVLAVSSSWQGRSYAIVQKSGKKYLVEISKIKINEEKTLPDYEKFQVNYLIKSHENYFICGGTDFSTKKSRFHLSCISFYNSLAAKKSDLICDIQNISFTDSNNDALLSANEEGYFTFTVKNNTDQPFNGGNYKIISQKIASGLTISTKTDGYLPYIAPGESSFEITIGLKVGKKVEDFETILEFKLEGMESGCILKVKTGEKIQVQAMSSIHIEEPNLFKNTDKVITVRDGNLTTRARIISKKPINKENIHVRLGDKELTGNKNDGKPMDSLINSNGEYVYEFSFDLTDLPLGKSKVQFYLDTDGAYSDPFWVENKGIKPNLHLIAIGPKYSNLSYTMKDARDFINVMQRQKDAGLFGDIFIDSLIGSAATADSIKHVFGQVRNRSESLKNQYNKIYPTDYLVVFYSGHGDKIDGNFHLIPTGYSSEYPINTAVEYKDILGKYINHTGCKVVLFIDACLSGDGAKSNTSPDDIITLANQAPKGVTSFSSCSSNEKSWEYKDNKSGNGVFTKALLEALNFEEGTLIQVGDSILNSKSDFQYFNLEQNNRNNHQKYNKVKRKVEIRKDKNDQSYITLSALDAYLRARVPAIQFEEGGVSQNPTIIINEIKPDVPFYILPK